MSEDLQVTETTTISNGQPLIKPWNTLLMALIGVGSWVGFSIWVLCNNPTEAERASIREVAETFATAAFFFYIGSSVGSRNKEPR